MPMLAGPSRRSRRSPGLPGLGAAAAATGIAGRAGPPGRPLPRIGRPWGADRPSTRSRSSPGGRLPIAVAFPERESLERLGRRRGAGDARAGGRRRMRRPRSRPGPTWAAARSRSSSTRPGLAHKTEAGGVLLGPGRRGGDPRRRSAPGRCPSAAQRRRDGPGPARGADGARRGRADRRRAPRRGLRAGGAGRAWRDPRRGARRCRAPPRAGRPRRVPASLELLRGAPSFAASAADRASTSTPRRDPGPRRCWPHARGRPEQDPLEVDLNPVIAWPGGAVAVDALVVLEDASTG